MHSITIQTTSRQQKNLFEKDKIGT